MYQGMCGGSCGDVAPVLPTPESQLSGGQRTSLVSEATIYQHQRLTGKTQFTSSSDYISYKKARLLAGSSSCTKSRPPQSAIIKDLIAVGCGPLLG